MNTNCCLALVAGGSILCALLTPDHSRAELDPTPQVTQDVLLQQKALIQNQAKIDAKLAEIAENLRVARIFISRGR